MRHRVRLIFLLFILGLVPVIASCAEEPCDCGPISDGEMVTVSNSDGQPVTEFVVSLRFPTSDRLYDPQNPRMQEVTITCPDGPNPELLVCDGNSIIDLFVQSDPYGVSTFPGWSGELGYMMMVEGRGDWEGMTFDGLKEYDRTLTELVDPGESGCCSGSRPRRVFVFDVVIGE